MSKIELLIDNREHKIKDYFASFDGVSIVQLDIGDVQFKYNNEIVGVVSLINQKTFFELSKMAVAPKYQGLKIGEKLMDFCIQFAKNQQWKSVTLYSNRKLIPAIELYKKTGFKEVELEKKSHYERSDIKMLLEF